MNRRLKPLSALLLFSFALAACGGGGGGTPPPGPTPTPTQSPGNTSADCPTTGSLPTSELGPRATAMTRHAAPTGAGLPQYVPGSIVVTYSQPSAHDAIDRATASVALRSTETTFSALGLRSRVISVDPAQTDAVIARLRKVAGVKTVERSQYRRRLSLGTVVPNDPYYKGNPAAGAPYYENGVANSPVGQWDMWAINTSTAWGAFNALPIKGATIAIIDTGVDVTHPDLVGYDGNGPKIVHTQCYVTYPSNSAQSTSQYVTDTDGHGTNVAGIADADTNNGFGFVGVGYDAPMLAYRIFPTDPSGGCEGSSNPQCETTDVDEVSAINDAVANHAKVINLSLGASPGASCIDSYEETGIENAINNGVVVVAASGNDGASSLGCPAQYPNVIAVGASGLTGPPSGPWAETVATYTDASSTGQQSNGSGVYLVAPGGTASSSNDSDNLDWIANITSSQQANASQYCPAQDQGGAPNDCQALFTGTSQATPHVTGTVSLMLAIQPSWTPAQVAKALCDSANKSAIHDGTQSRAGCGRLDAAAAVAAAVNNTP